MDKFQILKEYFGHTEFRGGQLQAVDSLLNGRDVLCVMPTGAGKSICYQVPALIMEGTAIVVSPLISLMKDQVASLKASGIKAAYINSSLSISQMYLAMERMEAGEYKIVYVSPERLMAPGFNELCRHINVSLIAVDEAHCISQWGQDFRPSYLKIIEFIESLDKRPPVGAFTATATDRVRQDIRAFLKLNRPEEIVTGFDRSNLYFEVRQPEKKMDELLMMIAARKERCGIIYCATRKKVDQIYEALCGRGYSAACYHAGLSDRDRRDNQEDFIYDRKKIMVATNAFGMGIDKSDVSYVIHYNMPKDLESYYQEAGRAGRDGSPAECILLYGAADVQTNIFLIEQDQENELSEEEKEEVKAQAYKRLRLMKHYCITAQCMRKYILNYFGEKAPDRCENCSNCTKTEERIDITVEAQKILSCISRTRERFGFGMISDILRGSQNERIARLGLNKLSTYGIMRGSKERELRELTDYLIISGYLRTEEGQYPTLKLTPSSVDILTGGQTLQMKRMRPPKNERKRTHTGVFEGGGLFIALKKLRSEIAARERVPAYIVFSDASLRDMCAKLPSTPAQMLEVSGVGEAKLARYGKRFLELIGNYREQDKETE